MAFRWILIVSLFSLGACSWFWPGQKFSIYFQPYSAEIDAEARKTIHDAADYAQAHPLQPVSIDGFSAPADPKRDVPGLSAQRAVAVRQLLEDDGVRADRISIAAAGTIDPKPLPALAVRRVDINVGQ